MAVLGDVVDDRLGLRNLNHGTPRRLVCDVSASLLEGGEVMPRKKHTKCSTEGCIGIRANRKPNEAKCLVCLRVNGRAGWGVRLHGTKHATFSPGIDKFRSKAPPR